MLIEKHFRIETYKEVYKMYHHNLGTGISIAISDQNLTIDFNNSLDVNYNDVDM